MKKIITSIAILLIAAFSNAQSVDFESFSLAPESYDNGSAGGGDFDIDYLTFTNYYDAGWFSWNGFSVSNVTDNTTAGFGNQYASYVGAGNNGSENFSVFYPAGEISVAGSGVVTGFYLTNTTYTAISMRDGDSFSKQFGSPNDANGTPDGTNGEDYFRVWIIGEDLGGAKDSMEFYLADYRFVDNNLDYIVDTWTFVDVTTLSISPNIISFRFESSDVGQWGINTPQYLAIDDIQYSMPLAVDEVDELLLQVYPNPANESIKINGFEGDIAIYSMTGKLVLSKQVTMNEVIDLSEFEYGMYTVYASNSHGVYTEKLIIE